MTYNYAIAAEVFAALQISQNIIWYLLCLVVVLDSQISSDFY